MRHSIFPPGGSGASFSGSIRLASAGALTGRKGIVEKVDLDANLTFTLPATPAAGDVCGWLLTAVGNVAAPGTYSETFASGASGWTLGSGWSLASLVGGWGQHLLMSESAAGQATVAKTVAAGGGTLSWKENSSYYDTIGGRYRVLANGTPVFTSGNVVYATNTRTASIPAGATTIAFERVAGGDGTVAIDDVSLTNVDGAGGTLGAVLTTASAADGYSSSDTRLSGFVAGDMLVWEYDGAAWRRIRERLTRHRAKYYPDSLTTSTAGAWTNILAATATALFDRGGLFSSAGRNFVVRRTGVYRVGMAARSYIAITQGNRYQFRVRCDAGLGSEKLLLPPIYKAPATGGSADLIGPPPGYAEAELTAGQTVISEFFGDQANAGVVGGNNGAVTFASIEEVSA